MQQPDINNYESYAQYQAALADYLLQRQQAALAHFKIDPGSEAEPQAALNASLQAMSENLMASSAKANPSKESIKAGLNLVAQISFEAGRKAGQAQERYRTFVEDWATRAGWDKTDGEGAFEFCQRVCYHQGWEDAHDPERGALGDPDVGASVLAERRKQPTDAQIRTVALMTGFKCREQPDGRNDLNPYVYYFAREMLRMGAFVRFSDAYPGLTDTLTELAIKWSRAETKLKGPAMNELVLVALGYGASQFDKGYAKGQALKKAGAHKVRGRNG